MKFRISLKPLIARLHLKLKDGKGNERMLNNMRGMLNRLKRERLEHEKPLQGSRIERN